MESIQGKQSLQIGPEEFVGRIANYPKLLVDIGTGDGRYVRNFAETHPDYFAIGIDTCRENLTVNSGYEKPNTMYLICPASKLSSELYGRANLITINFPWGSLLHELLREDPSLLSGLSAITREGARLEIRINAEALQEAGWSIEGGNEQIRAALTHCGYRICSSVFLGPHELRALESTWAKRLAFGRDPRTEYIVAEPRGKF